MAVDQIEDEDQLRRSREQCGIGDELVNRNQRNQVVVGERRVPPDIARQSQVVEWHEDAVRSDEREPEMQPSQSLIHHAAGHLGEPEICSGKNPEDGRYAHHHVEVTDYEVSRMQINVNRGLSQEESADTAADEHGDETQAEQRCGIDSQV